jgi:hypothetical protein
MSVVTLLQLQGDVLSLQLEGGDTGAHAGTPIGDFLVILSF